VHYASPSRARRAATCRRNDRQPAGNAPQVTTIIVLVFAILLCLVNAVVWTVYSEMPLMGVAWVLAAGFCIVVQKWNRG
jgi:uncharacterized membrane protein